MPNLNARSVEDFYEEPKVHDEPFDAADVMYRVTPPPHDPIEDVPEEYAVIRRKEAMCGLIVYAKYRGEWLANAGSNRWLIGHLLVCAKIVENLD